MARAGVGAGKWQVGIYMQHVKERIKFQKR